MSSQTEKSLNLTNIEAIILFKLLLVENHPMISTAINVTKFTLESLGLPSPSSPGKMRREINKFKKLFPDLWTFSREGHGKLKNKVLTCIETDNGSAFKPKVATGGE